MIAPVETRDVPFTVTLYCLRCERTHNVTLDLRPCPYLTTYTEQGIEPCGSDCFAVQVERQSSGKGCATFVALVLAFLLGAWIF